jgi:hypothetical protein
MELAQGLRWIPENQLTGAPPILQPKTFSVRCSLSEPLLNRLK